MNYKLKSLYTVSLFLAVGLSCCLAEYDYAIRFRSGRIIAAELFPGDSASMMVKNVNKYDPPSKINSDVGYVALIVNLDPGRSISVYDYVLKDAAGRTYPCVAIKERNGEFDASKWIYENAPQSNRYVMLFRVQQPPPNKPQEYKLDLNLIRTQTDSVTVPVVRLNNIPFSDPASFPESGLALAPPEDVKAFYGKIYKEIEDKKALEIKKKQEAEEKRIAEETAKREAEEKLKAEKEKQEKEKEKKAEKKTEKKEPVAEGKGEIKTFVKLTPARLRRLEGKTEKEKAEIIKAWEKNEMEKQRLAKEKLEKKKTEDSAETKK
ncbi:MAG TPA: hypothetical protein PK821_05795 [Victivallales bacterium]|mgnify:CR=1 FL=1|nr:hypothetical protein [Victivallales bacterium]